MVMATAAVVVLVVGGSGQGTTQHGIVRYSTQDKTQSRVCGSCRGVGYQ